jgi:hypothetical protein
MLEITLSLWGCVPEISTGCVDMTNASSCYAGIVGGAIIGGIVSWWIYYRQKKTSNMQEHILCRIKDLEENHDEILRKLETIDEAHAYALDSIKDTVMKGYSK